MRRETLWYGEPWFCIHESLLSYAYSAGIVCFYASNISIQRVVEQNYYIAVYFAYFLEACL